MRIVIVSRSGPLEQMIGYIVERGIEIEVVGDVDSVAESGQIVAQEQPAWLFLLADSPHDMWRQLNDVRAAHSGLNIAAFAEGGRQVNILYGAKPGENGEAANAWESMSTSDFIAALTEEPALPDQTPRLTEKEEHRA